MKLKINVDKKIVLVVMKDEIANIEKDKVNEEEMEEVVTFK